MTNRLRAWILFAPTSSANWSSSWKRDLSVTSVVVTHDMKSAYKVADRIVMLHNGRIIADGDADHIRSHPHPTVQQFIHGQCQRG